MITTTTNLLTLIVTGIIVGGSAVVMLQVGAHKYSPLANLSLIPRAPPPPPFPVLKLDVMLMGVVSSLASALAKNPHLHLCCSILEGLGTNSVKTISNTNSVVVTQESSWSWGVMGNGELAKALARLRTVMVKGLPGCNKGQCDGKPLGSKSEQELPMLMPIENEGVKQRCSRWRMGGKRCKAIYGQEMSIGEWVMITGMPYMG
ncbi:hypothetical protein HDU93_005843 [Gonapodya sp. JEL0774]|nr:hypothetical protein HDU93_005843 [Gonapodya sp. JEL0774]